MPDLRYPIGKFDVSAPVTPELRTAAMGDLAQLPERLRAAATRTRAARQNFDQILQDIFADATSKMSSAGRKAVADWPPGRKSETKQQ